MIHTNHHPPVIQGQKFTTNICFVTAKTAKDPSLTSIQKVTACLNVLLIASFGSIRGSPGCCLAPCSSAGSLETIQAGDRGVNKTKLQAVQLENSVIWEKNSSSIPNNPSRCSDQERGSREGTCFGSNSPKPTLKLERSRPKGGQVYLHELHKTSVHNSASLQTNHTKDPLHTQSSAQP